MHGNVREWCADWYGAYPTAAPLDPEGSSTRSRVLRGGSWCDVGGATRCAVRYWSMPGKRDHSVGFRLALDRDE
ncbi:MAG: SUMF1/EgtB/PvdO family nonheme iron enzyme [Candidatus Accumulibacter phosphatis]|uniref:formylglycine-generating enzyme family protein n=1 Tax=Candidatus Accumulibacter TaxID=327159 RepID=UPI00207BA966|nr:MULTISPECIES: SUMF1/EgtB/PvdO family nonheme iron enzyme [Candidatus Accumulibacter]HRF10637.1 SUMF1/EgtB/PvdO family nonheme iron enzyme [Candidatus Accumulibacter phosphatis]